MESRTDRQRLSERRRERRNRRRREEILAAAATVFAEKGYATTTVREIARLADVAEGTLYNYFAGKREMLLAIVEATRPRMEEALLESGAVKDRDSLIAMFERALNVSEERLPFVRTLLTEAWVDDGFLHRFVAHRFNAVQEALQQLISERVAAGAFRPIEPQLGARLISGLFAGLMLPVLRGLEPPPSPKERRALAIAAVDLLLDGVRLRPGEGGE